MPSIRAAQGKKTGFTVLSNVAGRDRRLSGLARGIVYLVLSHPADWEFSVEWLVSELPGDSRAAINAAIKELETLGYLGRTKRSGGRGVWIWTHWLSDEPLPADKQTPSKANKGAPKKPQVKAAEAPVTSGSFTYDVNTSHENTCYVNHEHETTCGNVVSPQVVSCVQSTSDVNLEHKKKEVLPKEVLQEGSKTSELEGSPGQPAFALPLIQAMQARGLTAIRWNLTGKWALLQTLMNLKGVEEMADCAAIAAAASPKPVKFASYFIDPWKDLGPKPPIGMELVEPKRPVPIARKSTTTDRVDAVDDAFEQFKAQTGYVGRPEESTRPNTIQGVISR